MFFFNETASTEIYALSLHDALPIWPRRETFCGVLQQRFGREHLEHLLGVLTPVGRTVQVATGGEPRGDKRDEDRKSTRLNSSHVRISYAVFCLKKKKQQH